jgi:uncharacterized protein
MKEKIILIMVCIILGTFSIAQSKERPKRNNLTEITEISAGELEIFRSGKITTIKKKIEEGFNLNRHLVGNGMTPLMYACAAGRTDVVKLLIAKDANVNAKDKQYETPLIHAVFGKKTEIVRMLISAGAKVNFKTKDKEKWKSDRTPPGATIISLREAKTALHDAAMLGATEIIDILISAGAEIESTTNTDVTPLMIAVNNNHLEAVKLLVGKGAGINVGNQSGKNILVEAIISESVEIAQFLLNTQAKVDWYVLNNAANSDPRILKAVMDKAGASIKALASMKDGEGRTSLMKAVFHDGHQNSTKNVEMLLAVGVDPTVKDIYGKGALDYAKEENNRRLIRMLERAVKAWQSKASK